MAVVDRHGEHTWNPCDENLTDWAAQQGIDHYFLRWRENRHKRHEQFSALVIERVLTRASRSYLLAPGPDIMQAMLETIHGLDRGAKLYELVMSADRKSVERDLKAHYHTTDSAMGMPVEKYLFDAMRRLIKSGQWFANEKGARIWRFKEGIHIVWRIGAQDIVDTLAKDKVPGIPRDEDTLADILIERGLAIPKTLPDGRQYRYWRMQPQGLEVTLYMLRLASMELIFSNEPPVVVEGVEIDDATETAVIRKLELEKNITHPGSQPDIQIDNRLSTPESTTPSPIQYCQYPTTTDLTSDVQRCPLAMVQPINAETESTQQVKKATAGGTAKKTKRLNSLSNFDQKNEPAFILAPENGGIDTARNWLHAQGLAGQWLIQIATEINQGQWQLGIDLLEIENQWLLPFPNTTQHLNVEPNLFIKTLEEKGWLITDVLSPMRKVQVINQVRGLLLATEPSGFMKQMITVSNLPLVTATFKQPSKLDNQGPTQDSNGKRLQKKSVKPFKKQELKQVLATPKLQATDQQPLAATQSSKPTRVKPVQATQKDILCPKPQSEAEPAITHKPAQPKNILNELSKTSPAQNPVRSPPSGNQTVIALIDQLRTYRSVSEAAIAGKTWHSVEETDIAQYLSQHPELKRSALLREMASHPDCRMDDGGFKVRIDP
jgi:hypothetical protein